MIPMHENIPAIRPKIYRGCSPTMMSGKIPGQIHMTSDIRKRPGTLHTRPITPRITAERKTTPTDKPPASTIIITALGTATMVLADKPLTIPTQSTVTMVPVDKPLTIPTLGTATMVPADKLPTIPTQDTDTAGLTAVRCRGKMAITCIPRCIQQKPSRRPCLRNRRRGKR